MCNCKTTNTSKQAICSVTIYCNLSVGTCTNCRAKLKLIDRFLFPTSVTWCGDFISLISSRRVVDKVLDILPFSLGVNKLICCSVKSENTQCLCAETNLLSLISTTSEHFISARQHAERAICYRPSVCPSVRLSVRPSHGWISQKRLNVSSKFFHHLIGPTF